MSAWVSDTTQQKNTTIGAPTCQGTGVQSNTWKAAHIVMCSMYDDWNTDHRRWVKRCLLIRGDHIKNSFDKRSIPWMGIDFVCHS